MYKHYQRPLFIALLTSFYFCGQILAAEDRIGAAFELMDVYDHDSDGRIGPNEYKAPAPTLPVQILGDGFELLKPWTDVVDSHLAATSGQVVLIGSNIVFVYDGLNSDPERVLKSDKVIRIGRFTDEVYYPTNGDVYATSLVRPIKFEAYVRSLDGELSLTDSLDEIAARQRKALRADLANELAAERSVTKFKYRVFDSKRRRNFSPLQIHFGYETFTIQDLYNIGGKFLVSANSNRTHSELSEQGYYHETINFELKVLPHGNFQLEGHREGAFVARHYISDPFSVDATNVNIQLTRRCKVLGWSRTKTVNFCLNAVCGLAAD